MTDGSKKYKLTENSCLKNAWVNHTAYNVEYITYFFVLMIIIKETD